MPAAASCSGEYWRWLVEAGMVEHRVDAAEARRPAAELERVHEALARLATALELEGEHPAEAVELAPGEARAAGSSRGRRRGRVRPAAWPSRKRATASAFSLRAPAQERQGLEAAPDEEGRERVEHRADLDLVRSRRRDELAAPGDDARHDVVVAVQVLRRRLADEVGAELERPAENRRGERVVHDQEAVALGRRERREVGEGEARVGHRLDVAHPRRPLPGGRVGDVEVDDLHAAGPELRLGELVGRPVELLREEQRVAGARVEWSAALIAAMPDAKDCAASAPSSSASTALSSSTVGLRSRA